MQGALEVREAPGRGKGVFASENLPANQLVIAEPALLSVPGVEAIRASVAEKHPALSRSLGSVGMRRLNALCAVDACLVNACTAAVSKLTPANRCAFLSLGDAFGWRDEQLHVGSWVRVEEAPPEAPELRSAQGMLIAHDKDVATVQAAGRRFEVAVDAVRVILPGKTVPGVLLTNAVTLEEEDVAEVYLTFSRLNHSCTPNAKVIQDDGMRGVFTTQPVPAGDEICISYFDVENCMPAERLQGMADLIGAEPSMLHIALARQQLFSKWGFWCACERCRDIQVSADDALHRWMAVATSADDEEAERLEWIANDLGVDIEVNGCDIG
eukprot:gnl/TRDRNA2_/TRDRNA2_83507_c0_seq1.p1 gnl/TRDRNA2_/TRDRNA2_83507_c0~~gnl/TRDRNA2_/TRDRNA2_83507_c0_seq1.p1  ORF type:complete len:326 (+),score=55.05 gnl/TRDRNA2_/TRDRNA2_83507_c0_seq1:94-1071(+)